MAFVNEDGLETLKLVNGENTCDLSDVSNTKIFQDIKRKKLKAQTSLNLVSDDPKAVQIEFGFYRQNFFDEFEGALIGRIPISEIFKDIEAFRYGKTGFLILLDKKGTVLSHPQRENILRKVTAEGKQAEKIISQAFAMQSGSGRATILGADGYVAYVPVKERSWIVMAVLPYQEFMAAPRTMRKISFAITAFILVILPVAP